ncbi:putative lactam utilization protein, UPF0271 family [Candidatus Terasakiella magnetica]|uniref:5-oxoprolinase subunit A n=1 Tax=Candidatus Terasakiella magnetica TaxID=1867952 RepID=A0A1C3RHU3_9PROT|nr:5-oxoprolinase subunit PxpA [Candidatus Terasakiella magnetica]SCA56853.1 putative lactam utilization protein, UPF0271 family [Candidatus Terasakiella magnetica]
MKQININADMGESFGAYTIGDDEALMASISSANIACGFHGGDPLVMQKTLALAQANDVSIGAHPSFPDLQGFGRRAMQMNLDEVYAMTLYQIGALQAVAKAQGVRVSHVKPHGALNNMACEDGELAGALVRAVKDVDDSLVFMAPVLSQLSIEAAKAGLKVAQEIFADRAYSDTGSLVSRKEKGAVIHDAQACLERVIDMMDKGGLVTASGKLLPCDIHSICVHGDTPSACESAAFIAEGLRDKGYELVGLDQMSFSG